MKLSENNARFAVVLTAFHGGGAKSFHVSLDAAERKAGSLRGTCQCGCCAVIPITEDARAEMWSAGDITLYADLPEYDTNLHYGTICR